VKSPVLPESIETTPFTQLVAQDDYIQAYSFYYFQAILAGIG